jgi:pimeloyl-ACP methyl ester carboxylesterase
VNPPETSYVKTEDGVHIGYQTFGEGPYDLVVNDGWMSNVDANWDLPELVTLNQVLGRRARLIMFDRRGFGVSDRPSTSEAMTLEKGMEDMRAVMDAVGSERAVVYGFEAGAAVSLLFAASYPERTMGLVMLAPLVSYWKAGDFPWGWTQDDARMWDERIESMWGTEEF